MDNKNITVNTGKDTKISSLKINEDAYKKLLAQY
jgi:hypothetical protein